MRVLVAARTVAFALIVSAALWAALISYASAERISNFDVAILVEESGDMLVTERITYDFEGAQRHGIFREVLGEHAQAATAWYKTRSMELEPISVLRNGVSEPWRDEGNGGDMFLRIGDAGKTITGEHTYEIVYRVGGGLSFYEDGLAEVYWNVTGDEWEVPIEKVTVTLTTAGRASLAEQAACYTGPPNSSNSCSVIEQRENSTTFSETDLYPGSQLTVAQAVTQPDWQIASPPNYNQDPPAQVYDNQIPYAKTLVVERINWLPFILGAVVLWVIGLIVYIFHWRNHHNPRASIIAQYEPYQDFKPMFAGVLIDGRLDSRDITAGILNLAQQGFITIKQTNEKILGLFNTSDYEVTLARPFNEASTRFEQDLLSLLFSGQAAIEHTEGFALFKSLSSEYRSSAATVEPGKTIRLSDVKKNQTKLKSNYKLLQLLKKDVRKDLQQLNFFEKRSQYKFLWLLPITIVVAFALAFLIGAFSAVLFWPLFLSILLVVGFTSKRRTQSGYEARNHLLGFKDFLSVTDKDRFKFHNAPDKNPEQFMEYLPYAIAFGVEKEWAKVFKDIDIATPDWYSSNVAGAHFSATDFTSDLSSFSSSLASSGSSSSGSSGGGSAGGGSGGGGGGSW